MEQVRPPVLLAVEEALKEAGFKVVTAIARRG